MRSRPARRCSRAMSLSVGVAASRAPFYTEPVGQLPSKPRIKRLVVFAEGYGVFADYRDDFSLLDKIKQLFPAASPRGAGFNGKLALESVSALRFPFGSPARTYATPIIRAVPGRPTTGIELSEFAENGESLLITRPDRGRDFERSGSLHRLPCSTLPSPIATHMRAWATLPRGLRRQM